MVLNQSGSEYNKPGAIFFAKIVESLILPEQKVYLKGR